MRFTLKELAVLFGKAAGMTSQPVKFIGPIAIRCGPIAHLADVESAAKLSLERDLRTAPTPISGGMRKALHKEAGSQAALRMRVSRKHGSVDFQRSHGLMLAHCSSCGHQMFFDEIDEVDDVKCDRCGRRL